jgi:hypothetical protein
MTSAWVLVKRVGISLTLAAALFICVWVSRVFFTGQILGPLLPMTTLREIAWRAIVGGAIPAVPLGFGFGLLRHRNVLASALVVATLACTIELATSSASIPWWKFKTWWVLPLECITVLVLFAGAALAGARCLRRVPQQVRSRLGAGLFVLLTVGALSWPWLYSCVHDHVCKLVPS